MEDIKMQICHFLEELSVVPAAVIITCLPKPKKFALNKFKEICIKFAPALPKNCIIFVGAHTFNSYSLMGENGFGQPEEVDNDGSRVRISLLVVPEVKDVTITKVLINAIELRRRKEYWYEKLHQGQKFVFSLANNKSFNCMMKFYEVSGAE